MRTAGLKVGTTEWLTLMQALVKGYHRGSLSGLYHTARSICVHKEADFDTFDAVFAKHFEGIEGEWSIATIEDELLGWLKNAKPPRYLTEAERLEIPAWDLDKLRDELEKRLQEQKERHDGGNKWVGTGGTSPFGHGGFNPAGIRIGGGGGNRSAVQVAGERRYQSLRNDIVLDTRQINIALKKLRKLTKQGAETELDIDATVKETGRNGGEIDLIMRAPRKNKLKVMLFMDVGGSMDAHARVSERLFSAAHQQTHFQAFESYLFHNCIYETLHKDSFETQQVLTADILKKIDHTWTLIFVGDAWMSPYELTQIGGAINYEYNNPVPGIKVLQAFTEKTPKVVWLNPEPERIWGAPSIRMVRKHFLMFEMTVDGLGDAVSHLLQTS